MSDPLATHTPRRRTVIGYQAWRRMLLLHWRCPEEELRRRIPPELAIDTYEGQAYVGAVAFALESARARGTPNLPLFAPALELNLRTYVRTPHGPPGIFFLSLDTTRGAYAAASRALFRNATHWARGAQAAEDARLLYVFERRSRRVPASFEVAARTDEPLGAAVPGTLEHFLVERYVVYAPMPRALARVRIQHVPYTLSRAKVDFVHDTINTSLGLAREEVLASALASPGLDCAILAPERVSLHELLEHADDPAADMVREGGRHARRPAHWV